MLHKIILSLILTLIYFNGYSGSNPDSLFDKGALRYDFEFTGNSDTFFVAHLQTKVLPFWGSDLNSAITNNDFGNFRYRVHELKTGMVIFKKGFSSLFGEWLTTPDSYERYASFHHGIFFPKPINDVIVYIDFRNKENKWNEVYFDTVKMNDPAIINEKPDNYEIDTILYSGNNKEKVDLIILSEGYTASEMKKFSSDVRRLTDSLFDCQPFKELMSYFNVFAVKVPSVESGSDIPQQNIYKNTPFNSSYNTFNTPRYLTTFDSGSIYDAVDAIGWDHLIVLVNTSLYGGGGFYNNFSICSADDVRSPFVFIHEFGHSFAGLGDEYYSSKVAYEKIYFEDVEPWEQNLTTLTNFKCKWEKIILNSTPVPTPRDSLFMNKVGVFEGGGYEAKGVYSPSQTCWMKESKAGKFCPACVEVIRKQITNSK